MSLPDRAAVEAAIVLVERERAAYPAEDDSEGCAAADILVAAARAYLRAPTAPQGAEIARVPREPTQAMASAASAYANARYDWTFAGVWRAMYDAALTPIDAETKKP